MRDQDGPRQVCGRSMQSSGVDHDAGCLDMTTSTSLPTARFKRSTELGGDRLATTSTPGATSITTSAMTMPFVTAFTFPFNRLRALSAMIHLQKQENIGRRLNETTAFDAQIFAHHRRHRQGYLVILLWNNGMLELVTWAGHRSWAYKTR